MVKNPHIKSWSMHVWLVPLLLILAGAGAHWLLTNPKVILLFPARGAQWIRCDRPFNVGSVENATFAAFETDFVVNEAEPPQVLRVAALGRVVVSVDDRTVFDSLPPTSNWRQELLVPLAAGPGTHHLQLTVTNWLAPSLVRADCAGLGIHTDQNWLASTDSKHWSHAVRADQPWEPGVAGYFRPAGACMLSASPLLIALFIAAAWGYRVVSYRTRDRNFNWGRRIKWLVVIAWLVLAGNNIFRVPVYIGYDVRAHFEYVQYVATHWRVPLADEGWEMFHPPLYYFLSATLLRLVQALGAGVDQSIMLLRVIPLACGVLMVELCHRAARRVFPEKPFHQAVAVVVGGLVPMNLYMAQAVSNEPPAACFAGVLILICLWFLDSAIQQSVAESPARQRLRLIGTGLILGLAVMTKVSALIWCAPVLVAVACAAKGGGRSRLMRITADCATVFGVAALICGWYFVRNDLHLHAFILTHSMPRDRPWWQYPGYRTPRNFFTFGRSLVTPVYGDLTGIWDNLYETLWSSGMMSGAWEHLPPWHFEAMACGLWLSLVPMAAMLIGALLAVRGQWAHAPAIQRTGLKFALASVLLFLLGLMYLCLTWPIYSCVKSSYLLGTTPCLALLTAAGFGWLTPNRTARAIGVGLLVCWACNSYLTYFVF